MKKLIDMILNYSFYLNKLYIYKHLSSNICFYLSFVTYLITC